MDSFYYRLPKQIVLLINTIGPIYEEATDLHFFKVEAIIQSDSRIAGFLIKCSPIDKMGKVIDYEGLTTPVPIKPKPGGEPTYIFTDTLKKAFEYIKQHDNERSK